MTDSWIDYDTIANAVRYYSLKGYTLEEVPWVVERRIIDLTIPDGLKPHTLDNGLCLVGSAEQSFISKVVDSFESGAELYEGRFMAITPCFRNEPVYDELHKQYFMKLELFDNINTHYSDLEIMSEHASEFFSIYGVDNKIIETSQGYDILSEEGIELGSYYRKDLGKYGVYICGTGVAEPRFTYVFNTIRAKAY